MACENETTAQADLQTCVLQCPQNFQGTVSEYSKQVMSCSTPDRCTQCESEMAKITYFHKTPALLVLSINESSLRLSKKFRFANGCDSVIYRLKGIIYFGAFHFISRVIRPDKTVWFHDGITTGRQCKNEGKLNRFSNEELMECNGKKATLLLYSCK
jgi:hypothetical protein